MNSINILVVDDEIEICNLIKSALKKQGYAVTVRNNAIDISKEELNKFDLILLDVMMPTVDGFTLCRYIRDEVDCPIIFITAKTMEEDILEGFSIGADDYIKKPFSILELRARVEAHLRREHREKQQVLSTNELKFNLKSKEIYFVSASFKRSKSSPRVRRVCPGSPTINPLPVSYPSLLRILRHFTLCCSVPQG